MNKIEFYEVNFGEHLLQPLMTPKCFGSKASAFSYATDVKDKLISKLESSELSCLIAQDFVDSHGNSQWIFVFANDDSHLKIYEIKVIRHYYLLEH